MANTTFVDGETLIEASWLNDVNNAIYNPAAAVIPASSIVNTPAGNIEATDVQTALNELDTEKQPLDALLTSLAGQTTAADRIQGYSGVDTAMLYTLDTTTTLGTSDTKIATQNAVKTYVDTSISNTLHKYESASPTTYNVTSTIVTETHNLGAVPRLISVSLRCTSADKGYSVNDEILINTQDAPSYGAITVWSNSTQVGILATGGPRVWTKGSTGVFDAITTNKWAFIIRAWL